MFATDAEEALVIPGYEPYKIPKNWCWTTFDEIAKWGSGGTPSRNNPEYYTGNIPWVKTGELDDDYVYDTEEHISESALRKSAAKKYPVNTVMIAMYGATIGRVGIMGLEAATNQACANGVCRNNVYFKYLFYYAISQREFFLKKAKGGAQPNISQEVIKQHEFPLAPLAEQHRIVEKIDFLFSKLDDAKEKAQEVLDNFENRKASILHKAFTGELTAKWRKENGVVEKKYSKRRFDEVAEIKSNLVDPAEYQEYPHIAPDNIEKKTGVLLDYHTIEEDGVKSGKHLFYPGQILYSKIRPNLSKIVVVDFKGLCSADMYPIEAKGDAKCLWYYMLSEEFLEQASSAGSRSVLPKINQKELSALKVSLPTSVSEQKETSRILDALIEKELLSKQNAEMLLDQIEIMKKSILAQAFRGELGTNNPDEEDARNLLKKILIEKATEEENQPKITKKRITIPKKIEALIGTMLEQKIMKLFFENDTRDVPIEDILSVSSKTFDVLETIRNLEHKQLIKKIRNNKYKRAR